MSALFSWPTVTVGMGLPSAGGDGRRLRGQAPAHRSAGWYFCLSVALRGARRARGNHWPMLWFAVRATPVLARNHLLSVHLHHAERTFSGCTCSTITEDTGE